MATWQVFAQLQNSTQLTLNAGDNIWLNAGSFGSNINVGSYQDSTHVSDSNNVQRDITSSVHNTKYLSSSTVSVDSGAAVNLNTVASGTAPFIFQFTNASAVATTGGTFYAFDGNVDANPYPGITFQAAEVGNANWTAANGNGSALTLQNQSSATTHNFYIMISASPTTTGAKSGSVKLTMSYA